jgi:NOL1/NOP2/sun family putative RNA methylase
LAVHLPVEFVERMKALLKAEFPAFMASYTETRFYGLRVNTLKVSLARFKQISPFIISPIPWTEEGFYYEEGVRPGKHPYYNAGLYYIQEPSAMAPVELLDIQQGDKVLDLCAAPGGKSTQMAAKLQGSGILVVNDNHNDRIKALVKNLELFGVRNAVVLNELPQRLTRVFAGYFDKILVDAPCSGEGMFRKEEDMAKQWTPLSVEKYADMQRDILLNAAQMLTPGGRLVYSTCTFSPEENEGIIAEFIVGNPDFELVPIGANRGFAPGRSDWLPQDQAWIKGVSDEELLSINGTARIWPHLLQGEGHFLAVLQRIGEKLSDSSKKGLQDKINVNQHAIDLTPWRNFSSEQLCAAFTGVEVMYGEHLYLLPEGLPSLDGIKVIKPGWYIGSVRKNRFEPSHALAMGLKAEEAVRMLSLTAESDAAVRYLKGETLIVDESMIRRLHPDTSLKGFCLVCIDGFSVGWAKWQDGLIKNEYPAGWRWIS